MPPAEAAAAAATAPGPKRQTKEEYGSLLLPVHHSFDINIAVGRTAAIIDRYLMPGIVNSSAKKARRCSSREYVALAKLVKMSAEKLTTFSNYPRDRLKSISNFS